MVSSFNFFNFINFINSRNFNYILYIMYRYRLYCFILSQVFCWEASMAKRIS